MKRDAELVRKILLAVENLPDGQFLSQMDFPEYAPGLVAYHILLLIDADYLKVILSAGLDGVRDIKVRELTWKGHDYLDLIRESGVL